MIRLNIIPIGDVPSKVLQELQPELKKKNFSVKTFKSIEMPEESFSPYRHQYNSQLILDILRRFRGNSTGIITEDIYSGNKSFDFGAAEYDGSVVVSLYRLRPEFYKENPDFDLLMERLVKQVLYYMGQVKGLRECKNPRCIMYPVKSVEDIDLKGKSFCNSCNASLSTLGVDM